MRCTLLALVLGAALAGAAGPGWKQFLNREDWFGLRDAAAAHPAPDLHAGALAAVFHREADAIRILQKFVAGSPMSREAEAARGLLLDLHFRAGRPLQLRDVDVLLKPAGAGSRRYYGNLGFDLFEKAQRVTLDFGAMRMTIE